MITYIKINGFKSFHNFEMEFTPFTVVAGANASGKSNLFDAMKLLSHLAEADKLKKAFTAEQRGNLLELFAQISNNEYASEMEFCVEMLVNRTVKDAWGNEISLKYTRLRYELKIKRYTNDSGIEDLAVTYEYLENLKYSDDRWLKVIDENYVEHWRPKVKTGKRGIPYIQTVTDGNDIATVEVPQDVSEGTLRLLTLCIMQHDVRYSGLLCFEEPENGIHPARISDIAKLLKEMSVDFNDKEAFLRQIIINTHSPILVGHIYNWKSDKQVSIWYAEMRERVTDKFGAIRITTILPVIKDDNSQLPLFEISEQDSLN